MVSADLAGAGQVGRCGDCSGGSVRSDRSVRVRQRAFEVDGGQQDEDVGLQGADQQLEEHQPDAGR